MASETEGQGVPRAANRTNRRRLVILAGCLCFYVLAMGPVTAFLNMFTMPNHVWPITVGEIIYCPVLLLYDYTPLGKPIEQYCEWWDKAIRTPHRDKW